MNDEWWAEIEKTLPLLGKDFKDDDKTARSLFEFIKNQEKGLAEKETRAAQYHTQGDEEYEKFYQLLIKYDCDRCIEWYYDLLSLYECNAIGYEDVPEQNDPEKAALLRSMRARIEEKMNQVRKRNRLWAHPYKDHFEEIYKAREQRKEREKREAESRKAQRTSQEQAQREREAPEQQAQEGEARHITTVPLGTDATTQQPVSLSDAARQYSLYVIGTPGVGKSNLLENIALHDMKKGEGLCFLDPHGDSAQQLLRLVPTSRRDDVIFWDPKDLTAPIGLNPFYCVNLDNPVAVDRKVEDFISALSSLQEFTEVFKQAPQMLDILRHMAFACVLNRGTTLLDTVRFLTNGTYRNGFYPALHRYNRRDILEYWEDFDEKTPHRKEELTSSSLNKLRRLSTTSITRSLFQSYSPSINFRDLMDQGKILLVDLSELGEGNGELLGALIVFDILRAALSRSNMPERARRPFHLFADEFERFMTTAFPRIIDEGRKFKLSSVLAHQHRGQLSGASIGSTLGIKNKVIFRVNSADAATLAASFDTTPPPPEITGYQPVRTLTLDPWQRLFFRKNPIIILR